MTELDKERKLNNRLKLNDQCQKLGEKEGGKPSCFSKVQYLGK